MFEIMDPFNSKSEWVACAGDMKKLQINLNRSNEGNP